MPQTSVSEAPARAYAGQIAEGGAPRYCQSKHAEGAIVAGQPVLRGTAQNQAIAIANGNTINASTFLGFAVLETSRPVGGIVDEAPLAVMVQGVMFVQLTGTVAAGGLVHVGSATAQLGDIGPSGTGMVPCPGCYFEEGGDADDIVPISINLRTPLDTDT